MKIPKHVTDAVKKAVAKHLPKVIDAAVEGVGKKAVKAIKKKLSGGK